MRSPSARPLAALALALAALMLTAVPAHADFGFLPGPAGFTAAVTEPDGLPDNQAGSHPYQLTTTVNFNLAAVSPGQPGVSFSDGDLRDLRLELPPGLIENPSAVSTCTQAQFNTPRSSPFEEPSLSGESCPLASQIGVVAIRSSNGGGSTRSFGVFNLAPPPGAPSQIGFAPFGVPIALTPHIRGDEGEYGLSLELHNLSQHVDIYGLALTIWGTPWGIVHDTERGNCLDEAAPDRPFGKCSIDQPRVAPQAYLTMPSNCATPPTFSVSADSWQQPALVSRTFTSTDGAGHPRPLEGCEELGLAFAETASVLPTNTTASTATGLDFRLELSSEGLTDPTLLAPSQVRQAVVTLPEGITLNPSLAAGLGVCTAAQYAAEEASTPPGAGCPEASKIGAVKVQSPLIEEPIKGSLFLAEPYENPAGSLIALYIVARSPQRGIVVKLAGEVQADPASGRLIATFEDLPQLPYTLFQVHFREGNRAPLVSPATCGTYHTRTVFSPWFEPEAPRSVASLFQVAAGIGSGPCPGALPPFTPQANAGTLNANAGSYTPFYLHLTRRDTEQEITSYSARLPAGLLGNISAVPYCPEADIEAAKLITGVQEEKHPSCPAASEIGHTETGYGVGPVLAYAPGRLYLAGPYHGAPLSIVAIDSATVGPFDLGVIVVRSAIEVDPRSAQVSIDSAASDPIPHIRDGIPLHLRDIRVYISRPHFTLNPTSCEPFSVSSTLTGSAAPFTDPRDVSATAADPFQVFFCSSLHFAPKLSLTLQGPAGHGQYPSLRARVTPRPGDANIASAAVTLPPPLLLEQSNIRRPCTEPELEAEACGPESIYGHARAITPLLAQPLEGPVYLRASSTDPLPDLVAVLHGAGVRILLEGRIDSHRSGIRATFEALPDAPVTSFTMTIDGGRRRGILVAAENLCAAPQLAGARFIGQNNTGEALHPRLGCTKQRAKARHDGNAGRNRRRVR